jgi:hypothetical protein
MPDERFFHKRLGHSAKVNSLTDFEFRVWAQYQLSADDCGVMRDAAVAVQADNDSLAARSSRTVQRALDRLVQVGLVLRFIHQGQPYLCQRDWQDFQHVRYPRPTVHPCPPPDILKQCTDDTQKRFMTRRVRPTGPVQENSGKVSESAPEFSGKVSETFRSPARAGGREWQKANSYGSSNSNGSDRAHEDVITDPDLADRAGRFVERYGELFAEHRKGARYFSRPNLDFQEALGLCGTWDDDRLERLVIAFLTTDDKFCRNGNGSIAHFRSRASWCDSKLRESGL